MVSRMTFLTSLKNKYNDDRGLSVTGYRSLLKEQGSKNQSALTLAQLFESLTAPLDVTTHQSERSILYLIYFKPYIVDKIDSFML